MAKQTALPFHTHNPIIYDHPNTACQLADTAHTVPMAARVQDNQQSQARKPHAQAFINEQVHLNQASCNRKEPA
jgi:hypothetical protein